MRSVEAASVAPYSTTSSATTDFAADLQIRDGERPDK
jgi:hypothetical protein